MRSNSMFLQRLAYACGTFGHDIFYMMLDTYLIMFVTSNLFNTSDKNFDIYMIGTVTTIILVLRIGELLIDPFIGNTIDKTKTRWGKFKPWIVMGGAAASITMTLLYSNFGGLNLSNPTIYLIAFAIVFLFMDIVYSAKDVAIWSMIPALSFDSREREITTTYARMGSLIGANLVTITVIPIVLFFSTNQNGGTGDPRGWFAFACIGGALSLLGAIILALGTKEKDSALRQNKEETTFKDVFKVIFKNDQLLWTGLSFLIFSIGQNILNALILYYFVYLIGDSSQFSYIGVINIFIGFIAVASFPALTKMFSRRKLFFVSILVMFIALGIFSIAGKNVPLVLFAAGLYSLPQPLISLVIIMTIIDSVEYGQLKLGHRDEALILCVRPLISKLAGALTTGIVGLTAIFVGMTAGATADTITPENIRNFQLIMFGGPFILILLAAFIYRAKVKLTEEEHARIVRELEKTWHDIKK